jgi:hypothetical protein
LKLSWNLSLKEEEVEGGGLKGGGLKGEGV